MQRSKTVINKKKAFNEDVANDNIEQSYKKLEEDINRIENKLIKLKVKLKESIIEYKNSFDDDDKTVKKKEASKILKKIKFYENYLDNLKEKQYTLENLKIEEDIKKVQREVNQIVEISNKLVRKGSFSEMLNEYIKENKLNEAYDNIKNAQHFLNSLNDLDYSIEVDSDVLEEEFDKLPDVPNDNKEFMEMLPSVNNLNGLESEIEPKNGIISVDLLENEKMLN